MRKKLLIDDWKTFYPGIEIHESFAKLHDFIIPFIKRRYHDYKKLRKCVSKLKRNFINSPKKMGLKRKLENKAAFFMLMNVKLDILLEDLSDQFGISAAYCARVYNCWLKSSAKLLQHKFSLLVKKPSCPLHLQSLKSKDFKICVSNKIALKYLLKCKKVKKCKLWHGQTANTAVYMCSTKLLDNINFWCMVGRIGHFVDI